VFGKGLHSTKGGSRVRVLTLDISGGRQHRRKEEEGRVCGSGPLPLREGVRAEKSGGMRKKRRSALMP